MQEYCGVCGKHLKFLPCKPRIISLHGAAITGCFGDQNSAWQQATIAVTDIHVVPGCMYCHPYPGRLQVLQVQLHVTYIKQSATYNTWQGHTSMYSTPVNAA